jgi:16S rRNA C967 or C1407 C5-methylase (RsmB/RsmF family)
MPCSFCASQNEAVVRDLLEHDPTAVLMDAAEVWQQEDGSLPAVVEAARAAATSPPLPAGVALAGTLRFGPSCGMSGLFIAKIGKKKKW